MVDLVDRQPDTAGAVGSSRERPVPKWSRNLLRRRCRERESDSHTFHMVQDHTYIMSLGAGVLAGWWKNLGNELGTGPQTGSVERRRSAGRAKPLKFGDCGSNRTLNLLDRKS